MDCWDTNVASKIKEAKLYKEDDKYYLSLTYVIETEHSIDELFIPKVELPINTARLVHREDVWTYGYNLTSGNYISHEYFLDICDSILKLHGAPYEVLTGETSEVKWVCKHIKDKYIDMTVDEIERKLGYKINIVSEHKTGTKGVEN